MKQVFLTGASGFIGGYVLAELEARGVNVVTLGRTALPRLSHISSSIEDVTAEMLARAGISGETRLLHLAWGGLSSFASAHHLSVEIGRQMRFFKTLEGAGIHDWMVTGTCLEYGPRSGPLCENDPSDPIISYAIAKDALRRYLASRCAHGPGKLTWARLFYTFGEGQSEKSLYTQLRAALQTGATEFPTSPADQERDFLKVHELARLIVALRLAGSAFGIVNVCSGHRKSIAQLAEEIMQEMGKSIPLKRGVYDYPWYEPKHFWGDRKKLNQLLGGE